MSVGPPQDRGHSPIARAGPYSPLSWRLLKIEDIPSTISSLRGVRKRIGVESDWGVEDFLRAISDPSRVYFLLSAPGGVPVGYASLTGIQPRREATLHAVFWDLRLRGRESDLRRFCQWIFTELDLKVLRALIPAPMKATQYFLDRSGFYYMGRLTRAWMDPQGNLLTLRIFDLTPEDMLNGRTDEESSDPLEGPDSPPTPPLSLGGPHQSWWERVVRRWFPPGH